MLLLLMGEKLNLSTTLQLPKTRPICSYMHNRKGLASREWAHAHPLRREICIPAVCTRKSGYGSWVHKDHATNRPESNGRQGLSAASTEYGQVLRTNTKFDRDRGMRELDSDLQTTNQNTSSTFLICRL